MYLDELSASTESTMGYTLLTWGWEDRPKDAKAIIGKSYIDIKRTARCKEAKMVVRKVIRDTVQLFGKR